MKKKIALLLALMMLVGCMLGIAPAAETTDGADGTDNSSESYKPVIAYSNVNYTEDLVLMFAVPAPATDAIDADSSVKVVLWTSPSTVYSYKEAVTTAGSVATAVALEADDTKTTIDGVEHLVYKYDKLSAEMMTDIVYARPVVVDTEGKATAYGDVIDYSIVEYVQTAKGSFSADGTPVIDDDDVLGLLDSMLKFGGVAQSYLGEDKTYAPNGYLANDELHKIWITPVVAGVTKDKVFGGFFKYEEGGYATVKEPFYDGFKVIKYKDADGEVLADAYSDEYIEEAEGFQLDAVDADIEITMEYDFNAIRSVVAGDYFEGFAFSNVQPGIQGDPDLIAALGAKCRDVRYYNLNADFELFSNSQACVYKGNRYTYYQGLKTIVDPYNPDNLLFCISASDQYNLELLSSSPNRHLNPQEFALSGYGDTLDEVFTVEVRLGKPSPDAVVNTNDLYLRNKTDGANLKVDGTSTYSTTKLFYTLFKVENNVVKVSADKTAICTLPDNGLARVAFTIYGSGEVKVYCDAEDGNMALVYEGTAAGSTEYKDKHAQYLRDQEDDDPSNDNRYLAYASISNWLTMNTIDLTWTLGANLTPTNEGGIALEAASVEIEGNMVPLKTYDSPEVGQDQFNLAAVQLYVEQNYSILLDYCKVYTADVYK